MAAMVMRVFTAFGPPKVEKKNDAIRFGILGAAQIAPLALITPALSHSEVIVQAIAARDHARASAFAKKHNIPDVRTSYEEILEDPKIDAVLIPLPNSLHFEWAVRAIRAGKHVLLEKPSTSNSTEAEILFTLPELSQPNAPILLEAFHNRFHPAVHKFRSFITPADVVHVHTDSMIPGILLDKDNIGFNYKLAGGSMMMLGTYNFGVIRMAFDDDPVECLTCEPGIFGDGIHDQCDTDFKAKFRFPNGGVAEAFTTMRGPIWWKPSEARVTHKEVIVDDKALPETQEKLRTRIVTLHGFIHAFIWHRIDVKDTFVVRNKADRRPLKTWTESNSHKAYSYKEAGGEFANLPGEDWWMSYRYQLEEFVNRVKGRPAHYWVEGQDSWIQMKMIDMAYEKSGLGLRPTSEFRVILFISTCQSIDSTPLPLGLQSNFVGVDYHETLLRDLNTIPTYFATGTNRVIISNRVSYFFDWHEPSMTIDTACSSSMIAVHQGVQTLRNRESRVAVVCGTQVILGHEMYIVESKLKMLSPTGRSRMWDADADGYARGEGVAALVLKRLSDAIADGDHIECVIRETGANQDGFSNGITVPNTEAQTALIRQTYAKAGLDPVNNPDHRPQFFEAHGTGTQAGDPKEAAAIHEAFGQHIDASATPLYVGSVKTVIGHLEGAAGLAGILKGISSIRNGPIPPNLLFSRLNPRVEPYYKNLHIPTELTPWPTLPRGVPRRVSVNNFGFGGANAHAILEEHVPLVTRFKEEPSKSSSLTPFVFSALSEQSLVALLEQYSQYLTAHQDELDASDLAWTLYSCRSQLPVKTAFSARTIQQLIQKIDSKLEATKDKATATIGIRSSGKSATPRIRGVFTGQGAQWPAMGAALIRSSQFVRDTIQRLEESLATLPPADRPEWRLTDAILAGADTSQIAEAAVSQPLCTAIQIVLVDLLQSAGLTFASVVGHSSGEIAAAYAAGLISAHDAIRIAYYRGLSVDKDLLVRLLRITTIWGPFKEDDIETYSHTPYSLVYLIPGLQSTFKLMADEGHPIWVQWSKFFQANGWVNPVDNVKSPWSYIHGTGNKTAWEYLAQFPERFQAFNDAMQAQTSATVWTVALYPFAQALAEVPSSADTPLVVDIGGGKGLALQRIRELVGKDVTGRFILQDLQVVLDDATTEEVAGLEVQAVDFFQPQPVKGATVYYVRRVLHDWSDEVCVKILQNIAMAITDKISQRVVIAENIIPSKNTGVESAWQDMTMMALGGTERTLKQWETMLSQAGFQLHRTFIAPGTNYASIEAFLI